MSDYERISALPSWGDAAIPSDRDRHATDDAHGVRDVVRVLVRTWPYLAPMIFGYWRERMLVKTSGHRKTKTAVWGYGHLGSPCVRCGASGAALNRTMHQDISRGTHGA